MWTPSIKATTPCLLSRSIREQRGAKGISRSPALIKFPASIWLLIRINQEACGLDYCSSDSKILQELSVCCIDWLDTCGENATQYISLGSRGIVDLINNGRQGGTVWKIWCGAWTLQIPPFLIISSSTQKIINHICETLLVFVHVRILFMVFFWSRLFCWSDIVP